MQRDRDAPSTETFVSTVPVFRAKRSNDFPAFLVVYCGREDCPGTIADRPFLVSAREWLRPQRLINVTRNTTIIIVGRTCPYCSKTGRVPKRREIG